MSFRQIDNLAMDFFNKPNPVRIEGCDDEYDVSIQGNGRSCTDQEVEKDTVDMKLDFKNTLPRGEQEQREKGIPSDEEHRELDIEL